MPRLEDTAESSDPRTHQRLTKRTTKLVEVAVKEAMETHEVKVKAHLDNRFDELKSIMLSAFPDGDPVGHKQYHQTQIEYMNERRQLWKDIRSKSAIGLLWMVISFVGIAIWEYTKREVIK